MFSQFSSKVPIVFFSKSSYLDSNIFLTIRYLFWKMENIISKHSFWPFSSKTAMSQNIVLRDNFPHRIFGRKYILKHSDLSLKNDLFLKVLYFCTFGNSGYAPRKNFSTFWIGFEKKLRITFKLLYFDHFLVLLGHF